VTVNGWTTNNHCRFVRFLMAYGQRCGKCTGVWLTREKTILEVLQMDKRTLSAAEIEAAREARREYMRRWRAKNRERIREYEKQYWARRAAEAEDGRRQ
jgi:Zn-finger nucleic acid-binding protein